MVQLLANLYPEGIPAGAYEDIVGVVAAAVRADMLRKKKLVGGQWIDAEGNVDAPVSRIAEVLENRQPPMNGIRGGGRRYDLPSDSDVKGLHAADASRYPSIKAVADRVQRDLATGALQVDDRLMLQHGAQAVEMPGPGGSKRLVPRYAVPENELRRVDQADAARTAQQYQYKEPVSVQVGAPTVATRVPAGERQVSFDDICAGPSMPKPQGR